GSAEVAGIVASLPEPVLFALMGFRMGRIAAGGAATVYDFKPMAAAAKTPVEVCAGGEAVALARAAPGFDHALNVEGRVLGVQGPGTFAGPGALSGARPFAAFGRTAEPVPSSADLFVAAGRHA